MATWSALLALSSAAACATGVDVSDSELEEICATPGIVCGDVSAAGSGGISGSGPVGTSGSSGSNPVSSSGTGGSFNPGGASGSGSVGTSGTGGSSGGGSQPLQPLARGMCMADDDVVILYTERGNGSIMAQQASMTLHVNNVGPTFDATALTIRYWFTDDGVADFTGDIDYASQGNGQSSNGSVTVTFGEEFGSNYASIGFSSGGPIGPEGYDQIQLRVHGTGYQPLDQSNDFSFSANGNAIENRNITPYINGVQAGGCVPIPP